MNDELERETVIERLRDIVTEHKDSWEWDINYEAQMDALYEAIGCTVGQDWEDQYWAERLIDLIERPTCEMNDCTIDHGSVSWGMRCSRCGKKFEHESREKFNTWRYCPKCGAEVIDG